MPATIDVGLLIGAASLQNRSEEEVIFALLYRSAEVLKAENDLCHVLVQKRLGSG